MLNEVQHYMEMILKKDPLEACSLDEVQHQNNRHLIQATLPNTDPHTDPHTHTQVHTRTPMMQLILNY